MSCEDIDSVPEICHAAAMLRYSRKLIALFLAVWLPLFTGNALAVSMLMQPTNSECHRAAMQSMQHSQQAGSGHQLTRQVQLTSSHNQLINGSDQQSNTHDNCGVCQLACCGYLATVAFQVAETQILSLLFAPSSAQFQSFTPTPLDPPPLALA